MIKNELTYKELENVFRPILQLENIVKIKESIYKVFHFTRAKPSDKKQYVLSSRFTGVISSYHGFEVEVRSLHDRENDYVDVLVKFTKLKKFTDHFFSPKIKIVKEIKKICKIEILNCSFTPFAPGEFPNDDVKSEFFHQLGTKNPKWEEQNKISPLTIFAKETPKDIIIEFLFSPDCYERKDDKTKLKDDWLEIFNLYVPSW